MLISLVSSWLLVHTFTIGDIYTLLQGPGLQQVFFFLGKEITRFSVSTGLGLAQSHVQQHTPEYCTGSGQSTVRTEVQVKAWGGKKSTMATEDLPV